MRFRFCGDLDCPDWVLAEINTLSKMSFIKMKMLCELVAVALAEDTTPDEEKTMKIIVDSKIEGDDESTRKACISVLSWIVSSAARYNVKSDVLASELEQLGLPKEHASAMCKIYTVHGTAVRHQLSKNILTLGSLKSVSCEREISSFGEKSAKLSLTVRNGITDKDDSCSVSLSPQQLALLAQEMKTALKSMTDLEPAVPNQ